MYREKVFRVRELAATLEDLQAVAERYATRDKASRIRPNTAVHRPRVRRRQDTSNYLPLGGRLPRDRETIVAAIDAALAGKIALRPEHHRGL
jgi:hypothetical protein